MNANSKSSYVRELNAESRLMTPKIQVEFAWLVPGHVTPHEIACDRQIES